MWGGVLLLGFRIALSTSAIQCFGLVILKAVVSGKENYFGKTEASVPLFLVLEARFNIKTL